MANGLPRLGPIANEPTWHVVPPGPCLTGPRAWPLAQAWPHRAIFVLGRHEKHGHFHRPCQPEAH